MQGRVDARIGKAQALLPDDPGPPAALKSSLIRITCQSNHCAAVLLWPGKSTKRIRLPSASTITAIFVVRPPRDLPMA
jgi:hypothetical protein